MLETILAIILSPIAIVGGIFSCAIVYALGKGFVQGIKKKRK